jgi:hypothetical protein
MNSIENLKGLVGKGQGLARPNLYRVILPSVIGGVGLPIVGELINRGLGKLKSSIQSEDINMLCSAVNMPGRNFSMHERQIGLVRRRVAYGFNVEDITLTFRVLNDYKIKEYFEAWQNTAVKTEETGSERYELGYYNDYTHDVIIQGLTNSPDADYDKLLKLSYTGLDRTSIGLALSGGEAVTYTCLLENAYPTSVQAINFSDLQSDQIVELNVQLSYKDWKRKPSNKEDIKETLRNRIVDYSKDFVKSKLKNILK